MRPLIFCTILLLRLGQFVFRARAELNRRGGARGVHRVTGVSRLSVHAGRRAHVLNACYRVPSFCNRDYFGLRQSRQSSGVAEKCAPDLQNGTPNEHRVPTSTPPADSFNIHSSIFKFDIVCRCVLRGAVRPQTNSFARGHDPPRMLPTTKRFHPADTTKD